MVLHNGAASVAPFSCNRILHVGCGGDPLPAWIEGDEVRLDIDARHKPDIVASMTDMGDIGTFDVVICQHALEHLSASDVEHALHEFNRVLNKGGFAYIMVPDLEGVRPDETVLFISPAGPITGLDLIYGMRSLVEGMPHMQHRTGFISDTLKAAISRHFPRAETRRMGCHNLLGIGIN